MTGAPVNRNASALALGAVAGLAAAAQAALNGVLASTLHSALLAALVNNLIGLVIVAGALASPAVRAALRRLVGSGLPWWAYLGGLGGAAFVAGAAYAVPVLGVALFAVAQIAGMTAGAVAVDRTAVGPAGALPVTWQRLVGAGIGLLAVVVSQFGRLSGDLALGALVLVMVVSAGTCLQVALNARVTVASGSASVATLVNFVVATPPMAVALVGGWPGGGRWPDHWWVYLGGVCGVVIVAGTVVAGRVIGVLRSSLALTAGQLAGALVIDGLLPGGVGLSPWLLVGALLTVVAVAVAGYRGRPVAAPTPVAAVTADAER
ncbi:MAG TPA: DMT family transporter [Micromonosporaceae bacterium]